MRSRHQRSILVAPDETILHSVQMDPRWHSFRAFIDDMDKRPDGMTLDRIDPLGAYCKANCRWATPQRQRFNQVRERKHTLEGFEDGGANLSQLCDACSQQLGRQIEFADFLAAVRAIGVKAVWLGAKAVRTELEAQAEDPPIQP